MGSATDYVTQGTAFGAQAGGYGAAAGAAAGLLGSTQDPCAKGKGLNHAVKETNRQIKAGLKNTSNFFKSNYAGAGRTVDEVISAPGNAANDAVSSAKKAAKKAKKALGF